MANIAPSRPAATMPQTTSRSSGRRVAALLGIILVSLNLRAAATSVPPILHLLRMSLTVGAAAQSLLGTLPLLCFATFGIVTPRIARGLGLKRSLVLASLLIASGEFARALLAHSATSFIFLSAICLGGMGMSNVLIPSAIKHYFPERIGPVSGIFQVLIVVSGSLPSLIAVPVASALGWRMFVGSWGLLAIAALIPWFTLGSAGVPVDDTAASPSLHLLRSPVAWAVMLVFSTGPMILYALIAWLPTLLIETRGVSPAMAAVMLAVFNAIGLFHSFIVPNVLDRMKRPYLVVVFAAGCAIAGPLGLAYGRGSAWPWLLVTGLGAMLINIGLTLVTMRCRTEAGVTALSSFVQSGGYLISAIAPLVMGGLRSLTGGWVASSWFLAAVGMLALLAGLVATRPIFLDETSGTPQAEDSNAVAA